MRPDLPATLACLLFAGLAALWATGLFAPPPAATGTQTSSTGPGGTAWR